MRLACGRCRVVLPPKHKSESETFHHLPCKVPRDNHNCYKCCTNKIEFNTILHQQGNNQHTQENSCNNNHKLLLMKDESNRKVTLDLFL